MYPRYKAVICFEFSFTRKFFYVAVRQLFLLKIQGKNLKSSLGICEEILYKLDFKLLNGLKEFF